MCCLFCRGWQWRVRDHRAVCEGDAAGVQGAAAHPQALCLPDTVAGAGVLASGALHTLLALARGGCTQAGVVHIGGWQGLITAFCMRAYTVHRCLSTLLF